jgi:hypothetical protein
MAQATALCFAIAETASDSPSQSNPSAGSAQASPVIAVSPGVLDFGLVGVGRTKELTLTVKNVSGATLKGKASVPGPFSLVGNSYSLRSGQTAALTVRFQPTAEGTNLQSVVFAGADSPITVPVLGSAQTPPPPPSKPRSVSKPPQKFKETEAADLIVRFYSDDTSYLVKPSMMDGKFRSICDRSLVLNTARQQPGRGLAAIVLTHYPNSGDEETIKAAWRKELRELGYQRVVFLRGRNSMDVNGLLVLDDPEPSTLAAGK